MNRTTSKTNRTTSKTNRTNRTTNPLIRKPSIQHKSIAYIVTPDMQGKLPTITQNTMRYSQGVKELNTPELIEKARTEIRDYSSTLIGIIDGINIEQINTADSSTKNIILKTKIITGLKFKSLGKSNEHFLFLVTILFILAYKTVTKEFLKKLSIILMFLEENATTGIYTYINIGNQGQFMRPQKYFIIAKGYNQNIYLKFFKNNLEQKYIIIKNLTKENAMKGVIGYERNHLESTLLTTPDHPHVFFSEFNKNISDDSFRFNDDSRANSDIIYISNTNILALVENILERYIKTPNAQTFTKYTLKDDFNGGSKRKFKKKNKSDNKSKPPQKNKPKPPQKNKPKAKKENKYYDPNTKRYVKYETALKRNLCL